MAIACQRCNYQNTDDARFCLQCGAMVEQETQNAADPLIGKILQDRYRVVSVIGEGGMGKVYLAEQRLGTANRKVAIKTLHQELSTDQQLVARFYRECETVVDLSHPNTIKFYDFGELKDTKTLYIVMELIEGESLALALQRGPMPAPRVDKLLVQIAGSLYEAHQKGIVHRDLKPENVLLTDRGGQTDFVKVLDFGIAKRSEAEDARQAKLTKQGMVLGTPPYMSPEQFSGQALDPRSDIYSIGIMTYEMLTGKLPFEAKTPWEWATKHLTAQPIPMEAHPAGMSMPENKKQAILRALAKNKEQRQTTIMEFLQQFTGYQDPQAAWTMATSSAGMTPQVAPLPTGAAPRALVGTPTPMAVHAPAPTPYPTPSGPYPNPAQQSYHSPVPTPSGWVTPPPTNVPTPQPPYPAPTPYPNPYSQSYASGSMEAVPQDSGGSGIGKIIAIAVLLLFILGGGGAGAVIFWMMSQEEADPVTSNDPRIGTDPRPTDPTPINNNPPMIPITDPTRMDGTDTTMVEPTMTEPTMEEPVMEEPVMEEPVMEEPTMMDGDPGNAVSAADRARAEGLLGRASAAADANDLEGAIGALRGAQGILGRGDARVRNVRSALARKGSNKIGILLQQGNCPEAQRLLRSLRSVGADGPSRAHFGDWCRP
jgi:serine/threonine-protein kinase